ncbi:hypothetical protein ACP3TB_21825 (plasmid) [Rahnella variigena]|uniref:hypothetical protein n=1 Tax=Rahnella variigena TaxID=574964 RepID=UPI003CF5DBA4
MKKIFIITSVVLMLSSCSTPTPPHDPQKNTVNWNSKVMSQSIEGQITVDGLKSQFKNVTGNELPVPARALSCSDPDCYYALWSESYTKNMRIYRENQESENRAKAEQCDSNPQCRRKAEFERYLSGAKSSYQEAILTATPVYSGRADRMARALCNKAISAQSNGVDISNWVRSVSDAGLLDGNNPYGSIAISCWWTGFYGVKDANQVFN